MRSAIFALAIGVASVSAQGMQPAPAPTVVAAPNSLPLGADCATTEQCANGAECFASNAWGIKACGKYNAACKTDSQCATNSCNNGLCNGFLSSSSSAAASSTAQGMQPAPSATIMAAPRSLPLGADCATSEQCAGGAECFASNAWGIKACGKYNAACSSDSQCATNSCNNGLCNGFLSSSSASASASATASASSTAQGMQNAPAPTIVAAPSSLPLGAACAKTEQCAGGAQCFASTAWQIASCGKFNAACTSDEQCATNTCDGGLCRGFLASSLYKSAPASTSAAAGVSSVSGVAAATGVTSAASTLVTAAASGARNVSSSAASGTRSASASASAPAVFTGAADKIGACVGAVVGVMALAWAM